MVKTLWCMTERYKLMHFYYDIDEWELYDLKEDPSEMKMCITTQYKKIKETFI